MSVWAAKGLLQLGMCWRVGMGIRILIWNDAWVKNLENYELQRNELEEVKVRHLSDVPNQREGATRNVFREDKLRCIFSRLLVQNPVREAIRCLQGIQMRLDLGFRKVVVEEDSINVIKKLQNQKEDMSMIRDYIEDARIESRDFEECMFRYVGRNANETAN
ncbi:hypothetical protein Goari_002556 [Gossypium aridum]|uniref:RNase H type-1 domain-containing protein n=1 Tax=Gossypium aridum TaxID=34290 RepID=A0A7J8Y8T3_GOSAI|nr:hypothetical protein [Gossypium aridum]